jgi:hypothetical protein
MREGRQMSRTTLKPKVKTHHIHRHWVTMTKEQEKKREDILEMMSAIFNNPSEQEIYNE